jgi:glycosyltransferase involved in cell wall biosynthesis
MHLSPLVGAALARVPVRIWFKRAMEPYYEEVRAPTLRDRLALSVRASCLLATRVLTVSATVRDELVSLGIPTHKLVVFPNPVLGEEARARRLALREEARASFGFLAHDLVMTTVGHAVPVKGWDVLVRAFASIASACPTARLLLVGSTSADHERPFFNLVSGLVESLALTDRVTFPGHTEALTALAASDVFAMPSRSEGYGTALMEALAVGLPCVATRVGIAPQYIRDGVSGLLVERQDEAGLAEALSLLARGQALRERLAANSRAYLDGPSGGVRGPVHRDLPIPGPFKGRRVVTSLGR